MVEEMNIVPLVIRELEDFLGESLFLEVNCSRTRKKAIGFARKWFGRSNFKPKWIRCDKTLNTPDIIDRNEMRLLFCDRDGDVHQVIIGRNTTESMKKFWEVIKRVMK